MGRITFLQYCSNLASTAGFDLATFDVTQAQKDYDELCPELKTCVFVDGERLPVAQIPGYDRWVLCRNFEEWVTYLSYNGVPDLVSFTHDLADEHFQDQAKYELQGIEAIQYNDFVQPTGLQCAQYLCAFCEQNGLPIQAVGVHCPERPMGAHNIRTAVNTYKTSKGLPADCFIGAVQTTTVDALRARQAAENLLI